MLILCTKLSSPGGVYPTERRIGRKCVPVAGIDEEGWSLGFWTCVQRGWVAKSSGKWGRRGDPGGGKVYGSRLRDFM